MALPHRDVDVRHRTNSLLIPGNLHRSRRRIEQQLFKREGNIKRTVVFENRYSRHLRRVDRLADAEAVDVRHNALFNLTLDSTQPDICRLIDILTDTRTSTGD